MNEKDTSQLRDDIYKAVENFSFHVQQIEGRNMHFVSVGLCENSFPNCEGDEKSYHIVLTVE